MVQRDDMAHTTKAYMLGSCACGDRIELGRRHQAFVRTEVMLDAKSVVEAELVTQLKLSPELLVSLCRIESGFGPHMRKMCKFQPRLLLLFSGCNERRF